MFGISFVVFILLFCFSCHMPYMAILLKPLLPIGLSIGLSWPSLSCHTPYMYTPCIGLYPLESCCATVPRLLKVVYCGSRFRPI